MKKSVLDRLKGKCWFCHKEIDGDFVLNHLIYNYTCNYADIIKVPNPTPKRPTKMRKVPDCEKCFSKSPQTFYTCELRLVPVHEGCHFLIHRDDIFAKRKDLTKP